MNNRNLYFVCLKYFISGFAIFQLISFGLIWFNLDNYSSLLMQHLPQLKHNLWAHNIILTQFFGQIFAVIGLIGALKENYLLTLMYTILLSIQCLMSIVLALEVSTRFQYNSEKHIISMIIVFTLLWIFAHQIKRQQLREQNISLFTLTPINCTEIDISMDKQYGIVNALSTNFNDPPPPYQP